MGIFHFPSNQTWFLLGLSGGFVLIGSCVHSLTKVQQSAEQDVIAQLGSAAQAEESTELSVEEEEELENLAIAQANASMNLSAFLDEGMEAYKQGRFRDASRQFRVALQLWQLPDAIQAFALWHIYLAEKSGNHPALARKALVHFVAFASDLVIETGDHPDHPQQAFVKEFELHDHLAQGRAQLLSGWAKDHETFGRSADQPVPLHSALERHYFIQHAPPCEQHEKRAIASLEQEQQVHPSLEHVKLTCANSGRSEHYVLEPIGWHTSK